MDANKALAQAIEAIRQGALTEAEATCRSVLKVLPKNFGALALLGDVLMRSGRRLEALAAYEAALKIKPDYTPLFTATAILAFRQAFGRPPNPRQTAAGSARIQMTTLGANGRFGNQLLQYALVRLYAEAHGLVAQFPDWIGRDLFDFDDPLPNAKLPRLDEKDAEFFASLDGQTDRVYSETDIVGYFCGSTALWSRHRDKFHELFAPGKKVRPLLDRALGRLSASGKTIVALHIRRGDFGYGQFWIAPPSWYLPWLEAAWPTLETPLLYVATDDERAVGEFAKFSPWCAERVGIDIPGARFLIDHHVLSHAHHLAIANSSFSFTAAMLNTRALTFVRPDPDLKALIPFDPWGAHVLINPRVTKHELPSIEETCVRQFIHPGESVIYLGKHCSSWTNLVRSIHTGLKILEADTGTSVDRLRLDNEIERVNHLVLEDPAALAGVIGDAEYSLRDVRIDVIHFLSSPAALSAEELPKLAAHGYRVYSVTGEGNLQAVDSGIAPGPGRYVAMQEHSRGEAKRRSEG